MQRVDLRQPSDSKKKQQESDLVIRAALLYLKATPTGAYNQLCLRDGQGKIIS